MADLFAVDEEPSRRRRTWLIYKKRGRRLVRTASFHGERSAGCRLLLVLETVEHLRRGTMLQMVWLRLALMLVFILEKFVRLAIEIAIVC